jgi:hypothetical protein
MSFQWSAVSFSVYLLLFQRKYFEGSLYLNGYLDIVASIIGSLISFAFYDCMRIRWSFVFSITISLIGCVFILCFQQDYISSRWIEPFLIGWDKSPYEEGTLEDEKFYKNYSIPVILFFTQTGFQITF